MARWRGVLPVSRFEQKIQYQIDLAGILSFPVDSPTRSAVFKRVFGDPSGGLTRSLINPTEPVVAARWLCNPVSHLVTFVLCERLCSQWMLVCSVFGVNLGHGLRFSLYFRGRDIPQLP